MHMVDLAAIVVICVAIVGTVLAYVGVVVLPRFGYRLEAGSLHVRRWVFRVVPCGTWDFDLANIARVERKGFWQFPLRGETYCAGRWWAREGVVLTLKEAIDGFDRVYVTPPAPDLFVGELVGRLGTALLAPAPLLTEAEKRSAVRKGDAFASLAAISFCVWLVLVVGGRLGLLAWNGGAPVAGVACAVLFLPMVLWMWYDCLTMLGETRARGLAVWLLVQTFFFPSAWAYYVTQWRPRLLRPAEPGAGPRQ